MMNPKVLFSYAVRGLIALIMLQTLFFKFSGSPESVYIFTAVGIEPWGRYAVGFSELTASILLFVPSMIGLAGLLTVGIMSGALFFHFTVLGIPVMNDGGYLFVLALICFFGGATTAWLYKKDILALKSKVINLRQ